MVGFAYGAETGVNPLEKYFSFGPVLTLDEVASLAKVSKRHVERLNAKGLLPPKISSLGAKVVRFRTADILRWLNDQPLSVAA